MKFYLELAVLFLLTANTALGAVGDAGILESSAALQQEGSSLAGMQTSSYVPEQSGQASIGQPILSSSSGSLSGSSPYGSYPAQGQEKSQSHQSSYPAPEIGGPMQEQMTAEQLGLSQPQMESFAPDGYLGFVSASQPVDSAQITSAPVQLSVSSSASPSVQAAIPGSSMWYYPSSLVSANRFYVQTASGLRTVGGCSFRGYLPLWADIKSSGNFYVYEWYPGSSVPTVRWWGWTGSGWKKGWFFGDVSGWHILCYNSGIWSNYIYIYVYPAGSLRSAQSGYSNAASSMSAASLPLDAPVPPDPAAERIVLPDFNLYRPITGQSYENGYSYADYPARGSSQFASYPNSFGSAFSSAEIGPAGSLAVANPALTNSQDQAAFAGSAVLPGQASASRQTCTTCTSSTVIAAGVSSSYPYEANCPNCAVVASQSAPYGYVAHGYQTVYPVPSLYRCNEYYVQSWPGRLATVAGVFCGSWLPLWSKVSRPGIYWSFEWTACSGPSYYSPPDVKNFGYKSNGWYQTWFMANNPGWHILSYCCNDWSNYVYVYVWPAD
ncbi:MAG: hypothetical protein A4E49_01183 [Methanosaeta sp. PtaU1.Bin112]|nr:MAG: hypothetical protein A4E49_01183 [Methanosaeta sp. PtaU1.Bin112]